LKFHVFVLRSNRPNSNLPRTIESFLGFADCIWKVRNSTEINFLSVRSDWFGIFYDNEYIDDVLKKSLEEFFDRMEGNSKKDPVQSVLLYKRILTPNIAAFSGTLRIFGRDVWLKPDFIPFCSYTMLSTEVIFRGNIREHGFCFQYSRF